MNLIKKQVFQRRLFFQIYFFWYDVIWSTDKYIIDE